MIPGNCSERFLPEFVQEVYPTDDEYRPESYWTNISD